jgi:hypothetical protein
LRDLVVDGVARQAQGIGDLVDGQTQAVLVGDDGFV